MSAPNVENVKNESNGPQNVSKQDEINKNDGVNKFQSGGGGGGHNQNFNNRGRGGQRGNRFDRNRGPNRQINAQHHVKQELMNMDIADPTQKPGQNQRGPSAVGQGRRQTGRNFQHEDRNQRSAEERFAERVATISGPTIELPPIDTKEKKFAGRCRLYVGNLTPDLTQEELEQMFAPYGETSECFLNGDKNFAFIRLDYRANAEKARRELDGTLRKGRPLKVRFAPHSAAIKVKNLNQFVTNELLEWAFQIFGEIERAVVIADERGKSIGEGIVEFARKPGAMQALRRCSDNCYFITGSLRPVIVEPYEMLDDMDGYSEKSMFKKTPEFYKEREVGPRFAAPGTFEAEYGAKWKALSDLYKQKEEALKRELKLEEEKLEAQMEYARYEHETEMLREQLRQREEGKERQKREWELKERAAEEQRRNDEEMMRRQAEELQIRMKRQEEELRRRQQENTLFVQAHQLTSLLEQQEQALGSPYERRESRGHGLPGEPKSLLDAFDGRHGRGGGRDEPRGGTRWSQQDRRGPPTVLDEGFPINKRRRY